MNIENTREFGEQGKNSASVRIKGVAIEEDATAEVAIECKATNCSAPVFACSVNLKQEDLEEQELSKISAVGIGILLENLEVWRHELVKLQKQFDESP